MRASHLLIAALGMAYLMPACSPAASNPPIRQAATQPSDIFMGIGPFAFGTQLSSYDRSHWKPVKGAFEHMYHPDEFPKTLGQGKLDSLLVVFVNNRLDGLEAQITGTANFEAVKDHLTTQLAPPQHRKAGAFDDLVWKKGKTEILLRKQSDTQATLIWLP